jgi:hypothetical protein
MFGRGKGVEGGAGWVIRGWCWVRDQGSQRRRKEGVIVVVGVVCEGIGQWWWLGVRERGVDILVAHTRVVVVGSVGWWWWWWWLGIREWVVAVVMWWWSGSCCCCCCG